MNKTIGIFQIFILVMALVSFSYFAGGGDFNEDILEDFVEKAIKFIDLVPSVSAAILESDVPMSCCINSCQEFPLGECIGSCDGLCAPTGCLEIGGCALGCGFDQDEGTCTPNTARSVCEDSESCEWFSDAFCNIPRCAKGCCTLGLNAQYTTRTRCEALGRTEGLVAEFDSLVLSEAACLGRVESMESGACVFSVGFENSCKFTTPEDCVSNIQGQFYSDYLCSHPDLDTICEKQDSVSCLDGRDGVYWFDSCGNPENIYSSNEASSWNSGRVLTPSQSCSSNSANERSSSCGNCDYLRGSICGEFRAGTDRGNMDGYTCRDLNCDDAPNVVGARGNVVTKKDRINGESWCVYDGKVGDIGIGPVGIISADPVGSEHFKYVCSNGEVDVVQCKPYRNEICVEKTEEDKSEAICRVNLWEQCLATNQDSLAGLAGYGCGPACSAKCAVNPDCRLHPVVIGRDFFFNTCVPKYPPGFDLEETSGIAGLAQSYAGSAIGNQLGTLGDIGGSIAGRLGEGTGSEDVCGFGTKTCTVTFIKKLVGWVCIENCACQTMLFTSQMNNLCASLGDCGAFTNIAGRVTDGGYSISKKGSKGKRPPRLIGVELIYAVFATPRPGQTIDGGFFNDMEILPELPFRGLLDPFVGVASDLSGGFGGFGGGGGGGGGGGWGAEAAGFVVGGVIGAGVIYGIGEALGLGKIKEIEITFNCHAWQRPFGGLCDTCNGDPWKPCTKYRCESLGLGCKLINENTGEDKCVKIDGGDRIPTITPWEGILDSELYRYEDVTTNGFRVRTKDGECIQAFSPVIFGVETDVYSLCKIDLEPNSFEDMRDLFLENNIFTTNHTMVTSMPSIDSLIYSEMSPEDVLDDAAYQEAYDYLLDEVGDMNFYVKCANIEGRANDADYRINFCVEPGPDITPPMVVATAPADGATVGFIATEQEVLMYVSEPVECRWDVTKPATVDLASYESLANEFVCDTDVGAASLLGWECGTTLPITGEENKYYVLCRDQPWLGESEERNFGAFEGEYYEYTLMKSFSELKIDSVSPSGTVTRGVEPATVDLVVETSGGVNDGVSGCEFSSDGEVFVRFLQSDSSLHTQVFTSILGGEHTFYIKCEDDAGNIATDETTFTLELDTTSPEITRVYGSGGNLIIMTNEDATCHYLNDSDVGCGYSLADATLMDGTAQSHTTPWSTEFDYYVLCSDIWGNRADSCSMIVRPQDIRYS